MIRIYATTLNVNPGIHPAAARCLDTLVKLDPENFSEASLPNCDCVLVNGPSAAPYAFDVVGMEEVLRHNKPVFIISDADGSPPDCEPATSDPTGVVSWQSWLRSGSGIRACFYREWLDSYVPNLPFDLLTFECVGSLWAQNPKDTLEFQNFIPVTFEQFCARTNDVLFAQTVHVASRQVMNVALQGRPRTITGKRFALAELLRVQADSKISIALEGAGVKCGSHCEVINSVMAMPSIALKETYPWIDGVNCIRLPYGPGGEGNFMVPTGRGLVMPKESIEKMDRYLNDPASLYPIYLNGVETARAYSLPEYYKHHIGKNIKERL